MQKSCSIAICNHRDFPINKPNLNKLCDIIIKPKLFQFKINYPLIILILKE